MRRILSLTVAIVLSAAPIAAALVSPPYSSITLSPDRTRILIMLSNFPSEDLVKSVTLPDGRVVDLRANFPKSGAYDATTLKPIWQVNWYAFDWDLIWSDDFHSIARLNRSAINSTWAVAFYSDGVLVRQYDCKTLLTGLRSPLLMPLESANWHIQWYDRFNASSDHKRIELSTFRRRLFIADHYIDLGLRESYTFDFRDGAIITSEVNGRWVLWAYGGAAVVILGVLFTVIRLLWRKIKSLRQGRGFPVTIQMLQDPK